MDKYEKRRLRLLEIRDQLCGGSNAELARRIGKSDSYVARMLYAPEKKGFKRIGEDAVDAIDHGFNWPSGAFDSDYDIAQIAGLRVGFDLSDIAGKRVLIVPTKSEDGRSLHDRNVEPGPATRGKLPLISWEQAGAWESIVDNDCAVDVQEWIAAPIETSEKAYWLRVRGESMFNPEGEPSFRENDLILVEPSRDADNGALVIAVAEGQTEATFKQLIVEDGQRYLKSLNPAWPNRIVALPASSRIAGVVKSKFVRY